MNEFCEKQAVKPLAVYVYGQYAENRHTLMIYAEGELFAKTDISVAKNQARIKSLR